MEDNNSENSLKRKLGLFPLTNIVVANMIGAGIFTTSGLLMQDLHNPMIMIVLWVVGGAIAICGALSYGELGAAIPRAGGEYAFLSRLYHPTLGFLSGWVSFFVGFSAPIAASAIGFVAYMTRAFPDILRLGILDESIEATILRKLYAICIIVLFTAVHTRGLEFGANVQNVLTILKVGLIVGLIFAGFAFGQGSWDHFSQGANFNFGFEGWKVIGLSLMWIMFAYSGWNASAYIGSEVKNPSKNLPRSLIVGTGLVILLYFCLNLIYVYAVPAPDMEGVISIAGLAAGNLFGQSFERILSIMISFALFSSLSAYIILGPRVYYSMAKDKHFFRFVSDVHKKFGVPAKSIMLQGAIAAVMVLFGTFDQLLTYMGFSLGIFPLLAVLGVFKVRRLNLSPYKMPGFPLAPVVYILAGITILILAFFQRPMESSIAIATVLIGIPVYWIFKKKYTNLE
ncbi:MAG TPA: amino acid permease [Candidatus Heimdallarchaeota archaeon]|nr:amino acid permease [Candidatus Heimdallarchaeota archaeon]